MAVTTVFPAAGTPRPSGVVLNPGEKLRISLSTTSPAPIFTFAVDGVVKWDQSSAKVTTAAGANTYEWDHPTNGAFGHHQLQDLLLKVLIIAGETYDYTIQKLDAAGSPTKQLEESMSGAGFWRSDFNLGVR